MWKSFVKDDQENEDENAHFLLLDSFFSHQKALLVFLAILLVQYDREGLCKGWTRIN